MKNSKRALCKGCKTITIVHITFFSVLESIEAKARNIKQKHVRYLCASCSNKIMEKIDENRNKDNKNSAVAD